MAKLKAPLLSLGASQQIGKSLVFFAWKGLNVVREYVVPANPRTDPQTTQRDLLSAAVTAVHNAQAWAAHALAEDDIMAYSLWASVVQAATTWFNQAVRHHILQAIAGKTSQIFSAGSTTPGVDELAVAIYYGVGTLTTGNFHYGTSKTNLINTKAATIAESAATATITGLTTGVKYYWQFRPTAPAAYVGNRSGIYYGVAA